jgi:glycosyltransferase involved in cell wall biosynthesis
MKEKILLITNMYPSKEHKTFGIFIYNQVEQLRQNGLSIDILANTDPLTKKMHLFKKYFIWFMKGLLFLLRGKDYSVVHVHYVFPSGLLGLMMKKIWKQKMVITVHGSDLSKMPKKSPIIKKCTQMILNHADYVITVGQELYNEVITEYKVEKEKVSSLSMGVNLDIFKPVVDKDKTRQELHLNECKKMILFVGNITAEKGLIELVKAYSSVKKRFSNYSLHLIGSQKDEEFVFRLKRSIANYGVKDVFLHPALPQEEISKWMSVADVFVLPSYHEGFGLVALEAMACGTPVIGSGVGGLKYLLDGGAGVMIDPKDTYSFSEEIIRVVTDQDLRQQLMTNSKKKVEEHDQRLIIRTIQDIYKK